MSDFQDRFRGGTEVPVTAVDAAAHKAMHTIENALTACGARARHMFVIIDATDVPDGETNATVAASGYEDADEVLSELVQHAQECADKMGRAIELNIRRAS